MDRMAELLSEGLSVADASDRMGVTRERGHRYLEDIRRKLGPQAC
jgi:predicted DNA-binding protein (UPF0251 family)